MIKQSPLLSLLLVLCLVSCRNADNSVQGLAFKDDMDGQWGLLSVDGSILAPAGTFSNQPSAVVNGLFSLPDGKGTFQLYQSDAPTHPVSPRHFARIGHFFDEVTLAQETPESPILIIDREGKNIASTNQYQQYDIVLAHNFSEGRALVYTRNGKYGYMDTRGKMIIPPIYDCAYDFQDGVALVGITNQEGESGYQVIDREGNIRFGIQLSDCLLSHQFSDDLLMYKEIGTRRCCYLNKEGIPFIYLPESIIESYQFSHKAAVFQTSTGAGIINQKEKILIPANYEAAFIAGKERVCLLTGGHWILADFNEQQLSDTLYDYIGAFYGSNLAVAGKQGKYLFIDRQGKPISSRTYAQIMEDSIANRLKPQLFIRLKPEKNSPAQPAEHKESQVKAETIPPQEKLPQSVKHTTQWKEISKQNPFYAEAAKVVTGNLEEKDADNRRMILNYVEHLRTSYTTKDIDFLEQLFSEHALIIVGKVIKTAPQKETGYLPPAQVIYNVKSKREYLDRLKAVFNANQTIQVKFSDFHIMRHPTQAGLYGVSLRQGYTSDMYSDDGYLFLLWDFRDETAPQIHVRTWQPVMLDDHTPLPEEAIFNIRNFNLQ